MNVNVGDVLEWKLQDEFIVALVVDASPWPGTSMFDGYVLASSRTNMVGKTMSYYANRNWILIASRK